METMRQQTTIIPIDVETTKTMRILDLGIYGEHMLDTWNLLQEQGLQITFKEFPTIDFHQRIGDKALMEVILEFVVLTEKNKRKIAKQRQAEGIAKAREKGIKLGRREKKIPANFQDIYEKVITKSITMKKATEILDVDYKTYKKWVSQYKR